MNQGRKGKGNKAAAEVVPDEFRCKRSDGKRWRCGARAVEGKSMCEKHIVQAKKRASVGAAAAKPPEPKRVKNEFQPKGKLVKKLPVEIVPPKILQEVDSSVTETESDSETETETETDTYDESETESDNPPPEYMAKPLIPPPAKHPKGAPNGL